MGAREARNPARGMRERRGREYLQMKLKQMKFATMFMAVAVALASRSQALGTTSGVVEFELDKAAWTKLPKDVQSLYVEKDGKYKLDGVEVEDVSGLKSALSSEREARKKSDKALKDLAEKWGDLDPVEIKSMLEKLGGAEEAQLIKAGKIDEVVALRTEKLRQEHGKLMKKSEDATAAANARAEKFSTRVLDNHVRAAAAKAGLHQNAHEDALFRARTMFKLDEDGNAVQLDSDGAPVKGKDGKTNFGPGEWLEGMKETAPHWFPAGNTGGGAQGGKGNGGAKTMKRDAFEALGVAEKQATAAEARAGKITIVD